VFYQGERAKSDAALQQTVAFGCKADIAGRVECAVSCDKRFALLILQGTCVLSRWFHGNFIFVDSGPTPTAKERNNQFRKLVLGRYKIAQREADTKGFI